MTIPSSQSLILWISVFSITSSSADFGALRKTADFFGRLRTSSGIFRNDRVVFKNPSTPRIKISRLYLRKSWQVYLKVSVLESIVCNVVKNVNVTLHVNIKSIPAILLPLLPASLTDKNPHRWKIIIMACVPYLGHKKLSIDLKMFW